MPTLLHSDPSNETCSLSSNSLSDLSEGLKSNLGTKKTLFARLGADFAVYKSPTS